MIHVFGAVNLDLIAMSERFRPRTSSPASISIGLGGVGFNIARALGTDQKRLVTALGEGFLTDMIRLQLEYLSMTFLSRRVEGVESGLYLAFMEKGDLLYGAANTDAFERGMSESFLEDAFRAIHLGDLLVTEGNLPPESLAFLIRKSRGQVRILWEPVSFEKAQRSREVLSDLFLITPTENELEAILGQTPTDEAIFSFLKERRIEHLVVTLGAEGLRWYHDGKVQAKKPRRVLKVSDSTGGGDHLLAALATHLHGGATFEKSLAAALRDVERFLATKESS